MATQEEKRQALSKAMGAAFLSHQVAQLERSVDSITFSRDARLYEPGRRDGRGRGGPRGASHSSGRQSGGDTSLAPRESRIIDASALVYALPLIKRWVRDNTFQLIVPLQAFSTLDILKKAPNPLHDLARDATRFLEQQLQIAQQISSSLGGVDADIRIRLRAQAPHEEMPWTEVEKLFTVPEGFTVNEPEDVRKYDANDELRAPGQEEDQVASPSANDVPRPLRSIIQCALYLQAHASEHDQASLTLFKNGVHVPTPYDVDPTLADGPEPEASKTTLDYLAVASGDALNFWCSTFFPTLSLHTVPKAMVDNARGWLRGLAQAKEPGRQSNGAGHGRSHHHRDDGYVREPLSQGHERGRGRGTGRGRGRGGAGARRGGNDTAQPHPKEESGPAMRLFVG